MKIFAARSCVISFAVLTKYLMSFYDMFGNREISLNFIRLLVHISRVDQRLLMCKHAQFRCHYGSRPGCHRVQGAMTQIYSQRMQDGFFPSGQRRFCIQFVQLILIWKTRFARLYRAFFFGRPLILWNSQLFVTNVPTKVGYTSVSISIPHTLCLLVFLWYQIRREYIYFDWTMWVVSIRSFDISQLLCAIWPLCKGGFRCYHIHCAPWTTMALYRIFMAF